MEEIKLNVKTREELGKQAVRKLRNQGFVPGVVYKGKKSSSIKMPVKELLRAIHTKAGENVIIKLHLEEDVKSGKSKKAHTAIIKEIQYHPIKGDVLHVDFNEISLTEAIVVKVPVTVRGEAPGVKEGGILEHVLWEVEIECLPTQIPADVPVDVAALNIGDSILVKDLPIASEIKVLSDSEATVVSVATPQVEKEEEGEPGEEPTEPEVIMEKKPKEEETVQEQKEPEKPE